MDLQVRFLADFLSRTVLVGFLTGVGFQVGLTMLGDMFGVTVGSHGTLVQALEILQGLPKSNLPTLALFALVTGSILLGKRVAPRIPLSLFAIVRTIAATSDAIMDKSALFSAGRKLGSLTERHPATQPRRELRRPALAWISEGANESWCSPTGERPVRVRP